MKKTHKGEFSPSHPEKCGFTKPHYKSSWELTFMRMCDSRPDIICWGYEPLKVFYKNPFTLKNTIYVPDFVLITEVNKKRQTYIVEIKPRKEAFMEAAKDLRSKERVILNTAKWEACQEYAKNHGMIFKVLTENEIFNNP